VDARERAELVVPLNEEGVVGAVEREADRGSLRAEAVRVVGEERELRQRRAARDGGEREEADAALGELREDAIRGPEIVTDVRVVVLDWADRERRRDAPPAATLTSSRVGRQPSGA